MNNLGHLADNPLQHVAHFAIEMGGSDEQPVSCENKAIPWDKSKAKFTINSKVELLECEMHAL
jgi:hypothetical protein